MTRTEPTVIIAAHISGFLPQRNATKMSTNSNNNPAIPGFNTVSIGLLVAQCWNINISRFLNFFYSPTTDKHWLTTPHHGLNCPTSTETNRLPSSTQKYQRQDSFGEQTARQRCQRPAAMAPAVINKKSTWFAATRRGSLCRYEIDFPDLKRSFPPPQQGNGDRVMTFW